MRLQISVVFILVMFSIAACNGGNSTTPAIDDPKVIKYAFDAAGGIYTSVESLPTQILAVQSTLAELDELDETGSYGPNAKRLNEPVFYFVIRADYQSGGPGGFDTGIRTGWLTVTFESETGRLKTRTSGENYLYHPDLAVLAVPKNLASIDVDTAELFPDWGRKDPPTIPEPPATPVPSKGSAE